MDEEQDNRKNIFDITQYSERTRKIIFIIIAVLLIAVVAVAMFIISPRNEGQVQAPSNEPSSSATQAAVDDERKDSVRAEAVTPVEDLDLQESEALPTDEVDEARKAQQKIIEESLQREREQTDAVVEDSHAEVPDAQLLKDIATKGMLEYCHDHPEETKEQKQARMAPYFHKDNSDYQSPKSMFYMVKCSVGGVSEPVYDENQNVIVHVGIAWGGQLSAEGAAQTDYSQYRVVVDKDGIVSFDD